MNDSELILVNEDFGWLVHGLTNL